MADNMDPLFKASNLKIERAIKHIAELERVIADHESAHPTKVTVSMEETANHEGKPHRNFHIHAQAKKLPDEVSAIVGDAVHNLRAALDLMSVDLAGLRTTNTKGVYFPYSNTPDDLDLMIRKRNFDRAGEDAVTLLRSLQPYHGGNLALRALHDLDIQDKHHSLIPNALLVGTS